MTIFKKFIISACVALPVAGLSIVPAQAAGPVIIDSDAKPTIAIF